MRATLIAVMLLASTGLLIGCGQAAPGATAPLLGEGPAQAASAPAIQVADAVDPVAMVNGQPIPRERLTDLLVEAYGKDMLQSLVALEVIKQVARSKGHDVTPAELAAEEARSYPPELQKLKPEERSEMLGEYLERNGLTKVHWRLAVERNAWLREISQNVQAPTEDQLRDAFARRYGEKVEVRHLEVSTAEDLRKAQKRIADGETFESVAREMSVNRQTSAAGGLIPPFTRSESTLPEEIRGVAFALTKDGQVSSPIIYRNYHLLQLVRRIPPEKVTYEETRQRLAEELRELLVRQRMNYLLRLLPTESKVVILDPVIEKQVAAEQKAGSGSGSPTPPKE